MNELFKNKYKTNSIRLDADNYTDGWYFVTVCTADKKKFFGQIEDGKVILNKIGKIADIHIRSIQDHFSNAHIDKYVIMPNHLHMIIVVNNCRDEALPRLYIGQHSQMSKISPRAGSLPVIIGSFKSICSKIINKRFPYLKFKWQSNYYDHIIRDEKDYQNIWDYIDYNPDKWSWDEENPERIKLNTKN